MPKALEDRPEIDAHLQFVWGAFWTLHADRQVGMSGPLPIQFASIDRYAARYRIEDIDEFDRLADIIAAMDAAYLAWVEEKRPKGSS